MQEGGILAKHVILDREKRFIYIVGQIKAITATLFEQALHEFIKLHPKKPINVFIQNDKGGDAYASLKIYQNIKKASLEVNTIAVDIVFSGAFVVLQAGRKRFAVEESFLIFHMAEDFIAQNTNFNAKTYMEAAWQSLLTDAHQFLIFTERGKPISEIAKLFRKNSQISAQKALELNLIDGILPKSKIPKI